MKKVRLRFVVLIYRILALFLCHQSCIQSFAYCFIGVWNLFINKRTAIVSKLFLYWSLIPVLFLSSSFFVFVSFII